MSKTKHTAGPWTVNIDSAEICGPSPDYECVVQFDRFTKQQSANAARIVACVNACEGVSPEAVPDLLYQLEASTKLIEAIRAPTEALDMLRVAGLAEVKKVIARAKGLSS